MCGKRPYSLCITKPAPQPKLPYIPDTEETPFLDVRTISADLSAEDVGGARSAETAVIERNAKVPGTI